MGGFNRSSCSPQFALTVGQADLNRRILPVLTVRPSHLCRHFSICQEPDCFKQTTMAANASAALRRLPGTPVFVNEAGLLAASGSTLPRQLQEARPLPSAPASSPLGHKRLLGTPCFVSNDGEIVGTAPSKKRPGLKRLLGTPCFVTEGGRIVSDSTLAVPVQPQHRRLLGTPCFVDQDGSIAGSDRPLAPPFPARSPAPVPTNLDTHRIFGTPCFVANDSAFVGGQITPSKVAASPASTISEARLGSTVVFPGFPGDAFRHSVQTDKLETVITLESTSKDATWCGSLS